MGIKICSNGFIWLDTAQTASTFSDNGDLLVSQGARLAPHWNDLDPSVGGSVHYDVDPGMNAVYAKSFSKPYPNRATIIAQLMVPGARIEILAYAHIGRRGSAKAARGKAKRSAPKAKARKKPAAKRSRRR